MAINVKNSANTGGAMGVQQGMLQNSKNSLDITQQLSDQTHQVSQDSKMKMAEMQWNRMAEQVAETRDKMAISGFKGAKQNADAVG